MGGQRPSRARRASATRIRTSSDNAVVIKITLKVRLQKIFGGGNPVNAHQGFVANYLGLYSGNAAMGARPQLIVEYYIP